jgi:hypothetical protein
MFVAVIKIKIKFKSNGSPVAPFYAGFGGRARAMPYYRRKSMLRHMGYRQTFNPLETVNKRGKYPASITTHDSNRERGLRSSVIHLEG